MNECESKKEKKIFRRADKEDKEMKKE